MTIEIHQPELERRVEEHIWSGYFQDVDELLTRALDALQKEDLDNRVSPGEKSARNREETVDRILKARKGNRLPEGVTIRELIDKGRA